VTAVLRAGDAPEQFACWRAAPEFAAIEAHPLYGSFGRAYYPAVFGDRRADESFAVTDGDRPLLFVACARGEGQLDHYGLPIRLFPRHGAAADAIALATRAAVTELAAIAERHALLRIALRDDAAGGALSPLGEACLNRSAAAALRLEAEAELGSGEAGLHRALRKSFKALVNWGKRELSIECFDRAHPDPTLFRHYQELHHRVSGRVTRPQSSWDAMQEWVAAGGGELVLARLADGTLIAATLVVDGTRVSHYASAAYDRAHFDKPVAHWPLFLAMLHSGERGKALFDLGEVPLVGAASDKEFNIGYFKRGFATRIVPWIEWTLGRLARRAP
jgi:hypothetical protein